jgi:hypothetical protein
MVSIILPMTYGYFNKSFYLYSNTTLLNYYSPAFAKADQYFIEKNNLFDAKKTDDQYKPKIVNFGRNEWIKPFSYGTFVPLEVIPKEDEGELSVSDKNINRELYQILSPENKLIIKKYNIQYVTINGLLNDRWYPDYYLDENTTLQNIEIPSNFKLEKEIFGTEGEFIKIFSVH